MAPFQFTPQALDDMEAIWTYIARDSLESANRVEAAIIDACRLLARNPFLGSTRRDLTQHPLRFWTVAEFPNYIIVYRPQTAPIQVIAVLHGKRQISALLKHI